MSFLTFDPRTRQALPVRLFTAMSYRNEFPHQRWHYNPWTGEGRDNRDIESDPTGLHMSPLDSITGDQKDSGDTITATLSERGKRYGAFTGHAQISQDLEDVMRACPKWAALAADQKEALKMVAHKTARILNGDPDYDDSWVDIAGYAKLVADRLQGVKR